jgi:hypothetical protein
MSADMRQRGADHFAQSCKDVSPLDVRSTINVAPALGVPGQSVDMEAPYTSPCGLSLRSEPSLWRNCCNLAGTERKTMFYRRKSFCKLFDSEAN